MVEKKSENKLKIFTALAYNFPFVDITQPTKVIQHSFLICSAFKRLAILAKTFPALTAKPFPRMTTNLTAYSG